jgi:MoxR-like ATPase
MEPKTPPDPLRDLELLIRSRYGLILLATDEEDRAELLLRHVADRVHAQFYTWTRTRGMRCDAVPANALEGTRDLVASLKLIESARFPALYHLQGIGEALDNEDVAARLKDAVTTLSGQSGAVVLTGESIRVPSPLRVLSATVRLPALQAEDYRDLLRKILRDLSGRMTVKTDLSPTDLGRILNGLRGLTLMEAEKVLTRAIVEDGRLSAEDIRHVIDAKKAIVEREGLLEYYPAEERFSEIADLTGLKRWLAKRKGILDDPKRAAAFGLAFPKGILLVGVQGCGKSLCAKAVAQEWGLPLLKLDPSNLYNKYIGESERNFQRAMRLAERVAPVILWIDEIEKAFASAGGEMDGGTSQRIFGSLLSWMQDRRGDIFVVATSNDIERLPPEFVRKGRFDEIFFVDLPNAEARRAVFEIHLRRRGKNPASFDLVALTSAADGFSGAEIEQGVLSALYTAFSSGTELSTRELLDEIAATRPLSKTMSEKVEFLRDWAKDRAVSAQ